MDATDAVVNEIEQQKPRFSPDLLSREEKDRLIQRGFLGLYRWYIARSQATRNWNPDRSFDWRTLRKDLSPQFLTIIEGYYAVEQYAPDYTAELVRLVRHNYGRSHFQLQWGAEEAKHADLWRNTLLFSGARTPQWIDQYSQDLRVNAWRLPWDDPLRMLFYTVFQERATQLNYLNLARIARGESDKPALAQDADPLLAKIAATMAADEAAHYEFFLEGARLFLYYYPHETLDALVDVLRNFTMPAADIVPDYDSFVAALYEAALFGRLIYAREVVQPALTHLGITAIREVERGIRCTRQVPDEHGRMRDTATFSGVNFSVVESVVRRLFGRIGQYEAEVGLAEVDPTHFVPHLWIARE
jgi:acyl-[acyl-carrier protein] desaturase